MKPVFLVGAALVALILARRWRRTGFEARVLAILLIAGLAVYGSGIVVLPNIEKLIEDLGERLGKWTYALVAVLAFLETGAFVGLVAPGEFTIIFGGVVAGQGEIDIIVLIGLVWASAVAGDCVSFYFGRRLGRGFLERHGPRVKITEARLQQVEGFFARHGGATILIGRFVGLVRALAPFVAGASKMPFRRFLPYDVIGAGLWASFFCILGFVFWRSFDKVADIASKGAFALGAVITLIVGGVFLYRWLKEAENREAARAWIAEREHKPGYKQLFAVARPVYGRVLEPGWRRVSVPLKFFWRRITPGRLGLELTTLLAMALVGGFAFGGLASLVANDDTLRGDQAAFDFNERIRSDWLDTIAEVLTQLGAFYTVAPLVALAVIYLIARHEVLEGVTIIVGLVLTYAGVHITKGIVDRPRPSGSLVETAGSSFPSGHAAYAVTIIAVAVAFRHAFGDFATKSALVIGSVILAVAVAGTRIYLRAHYMTDVVAGFGLGVAVYSTCALVALVVAFIRNNEHSPTA